MNLDQYLPILLFILVGIAVGIIPQVLVLIEVHLETAGIAE